MKDFKLNITYIKVLVTIKELNDDNLYPLNEGIYKILVGMEDEEANSYRYISTFGTLSSFTSKKVCRYTMMLFRYGYLGKIFDPQTKKLYFRLTDKGLEEADAFLKKHKKGFHRKKKNLSLSIVRIEENN